MTAHAAKRCFTHGISYPWELMICQVDGCAEALMPVEGEPDEEWRYAVWQAEHPQQGDAKEDVYGWRWSQLWGAGFDSQSAERLASGNADLHQLLAAKARGCSDELVERIFL